MRKENRINCFIPDNTLVALGYKAVFEMERYSAGDLIVENLNSAGCTYIKTELGSYEVTPGRWLLAKYFRDNKAKVTIEVTDEYTLTRRDGVDTPLISNYSFDLMVKDISGFLQRLIYHWDENYIIR